MRTLTNKFVNADYNLDAAVVGYLLYCQDRNGQFYEATYEPILQAFPAVSGEVQVALTFSWMQNFKPNEDLSGVSAAGSVKLPSLDALKGTDYSNAETLVRDSQAVLGPNLPR